MPTGVKPISGEWNDKSTSQLIAHPVTGIVTQGGESLLPASYDWLKSQPFDYDRYRVGLTPYRPGSIGGGLSSVQSQALAHWQQNATVPPAPKLTSAILAGKQEDRSHQLGSLTLNMLDPMAFITELTGSFIGRPADEPLVGENGSWLDPGAFAADHQITMENAPSRFADYPVGLVSAAYGMLTKQPMPVRIPSGEAKYEFQKRTEYWAMVRDQPDGVLADIAWATVAQSVDPDTNQFLVDQLLLTFRTDRDRELALTSGNERADFIAKMAVQVYLENGADPFGPGMGEGAYRSSANGAGGDIESPRWSATQGWKLRGEFKARTADVGFLPFIGTWVGSNQDPITPETEAAWKAYTPDQRNQVFGATGPYSMGTEIVGQMALFSGIGVAAAVMKGAGGLAGAIYTTYSGLLSASKVVAVTGITTATATWGLQAAWSADINLGPLSSPGVKEFVTRVDLSRLVSSSAFAGAINGLGYISTGTYGLNTAARVWGKAGSRIAAGTGLKRITSGALGGVVDSRFLAFGHGGSDTIRYLVDDIGLDSLGLRTSYTRNFLSHLMNEERAERIATWAAKLLGHKTNTFLDYVDDPEVLAELMAQDTARAIPGVMPGVTAKLRVLAQAARGHPLGVGTSSHDIVRDFERVQRNARSIDDAITRTYVHNYGAAFMQRLAGANTPEALRAWQVKAITRLGGRVQNLAAAGSHSLEWWNQTTRSIYQYEFDRWAGIIDFAANGSREHAKISLMSLRHLFVDEADTALAILRGEDEVLALAEMKRLMDKLEVEEWVAKETVRPLRPDAWGGKAAPWEATPAKMADYIEDIRSTLSTKRQLANPATTTSADTLNLQHAKMEAEGLWTIGFKPVNEAGEFVSGVMTRSGQLVQTRWLDYPLSNVENIMAGNRGFISTKLDAVTRGFRTWRLLEYQRGSLFRSISSKTGFSPTQIEMFHEGVMKIAREYNISPQAVGRMPYTGYSAGLTRPIGDKVNALADRIFGENARDAAGRLIDWRYEVGSAYRQAYRLNLTSGLTSHLKSKFGAAGEQLVLASDFFYVQWRFGLSPLFKAGEIWESVQLNAMRRVMPTGMDPMTWGLWVRQGAGGDIGTLGTETLGDAFAQGIATAPGRGGLASRETTDVASLAMRRDTAAMSWHSLQLRESYDQIIARNSMRAQAAGYRAKALGGEAVFTDERLVLATEVAGLVDDAGRLVAGADEARLKVLLGLLNRNDLDPFVLAALDAHPWGVATDVQVQTARTIEARAAFLRMTDQGLEDDAVRLAVYQDLIDKGWIAPDPVLALQNRYEELLLDLREQFQQNFATPGIGHIRPRMDWTDPVTGLQVVRDPVYSSRLEFDKAIASIRGKRTYYRNRVVVPGAEDLAVRLDTAAQQMLVPRPILRSDRVGPPDGIPDGFTTDPAQVYVRRQTNFSAAPTPGGPVFDAQGNLILSTAQGHDGVLSWLDLENTLPEDRAIYHTTTNKDAVMDNGLYSRMELMEQGAPPEAIAAIKAAGAAGTPASSISMWRRDGSMIGFQWPNYEDIAAGRSVLVKDSWTNAEVPWDEIGRISDNSGDIWVNTGTAPAPRGLGAYHIDTMIATTTDFRHAEEIHRRLAFLSETARGKTDGDDVLSHFSTVYDELTGGDDMETLLEMAEVVGFDRGLIRNMDDVDGAWNMIAHHIDNGAAASGDPAQFLFDQSLALDSNINTKMKEVFRQNGEEGFTGGVILILSREQAARIDPAQIGIVQVAVRKSRPTVLAQGSPEWEAARDAVWARTGPGGDLFGKPYQVSILNESGGQYQVPSAWRQGDTQKARWDYIWESYTRMNTPGGPSGVIIKYEPTPGAAWETIVVHGRGEGELALPKKGPDQFELQVHSSDVYVIDERFASEPLASDAEGLLRQLRKIVDDRGVVVPGYEKRQAMIVHDLTLLRDQAINPDPVASMADIAETAEGMTANLESRVRERMGTKAQRMTREFFDPVPGKETRMTRQVIQMQREEFPLVIRGTPAEQVFRQVAGKEGDWADFLIKDRDLLDRWNTTRSPEDFEALLAHAGGDPVDRAAMDALYASEEWEVISGLWAINMKGASEEAFGTHFFDQYRSPLLRSINHPVFAIYPASWALKAAREWAKFLFNNRMFGVELRMGMTPAVAIASLSRAQQVAFAQQNPDYKGDLEQYMREGPLGSAIFIFNLIMPGDWSSLPFPLSRTLREVLRGNTDPGRLLQSNLEYMGFTRDAILIGEAGNEVKDLLFPTTPEPVGQAPKTYADQPARTVRRWLDIPTR